MSSRKNKVLIVFAAVIITLSLVALIPVFALPNEQVSSETETTLAVESNKSIPSEKPSPKFGPGNIPNLDTWDLSINATRTISVRNYGLITLNDTFTVTNNDNISLPIFRFAYPNSWDRNLVSISAKSMWANTTFLMNNTQVREEYRDKNFTYYVVNLNPIVSNSSSYKISILSSFVHVYEVFMHEASGYLFNGIKLNVSRVPLITKPIAKCFTSAVVSEEDGNIIANMVQPAENTTSGEKSITYGTLWDVPAFNGTVLYEPDSVDDPYRVRVTCFLTWKLPIEAVIYKRTVTLDNWYWAKIHEEITIENFGIEQPDDALWDLLQTESFSGSLIKFYLGVDNAEEVEVKDEYGKLFKSIIPDDVNLPVAQQNRINVFSRVPFWGGEKRSYTIDYLLKLEEILTFEKTEFVLDTKGMPSCEFLVREFQLEIIFPQGASFKYLSFGNEPQTVQHNKTSVFMRIGNRDITTLTKYNISYFQNIYVKAGYYMSDFAYYIQPLTFALLIFLACLLYIGIRTLQKDVIQKVIISPEREEVPIELIQTFVEQYEEKTALQTRITTLDENRRRKKVKAKEYEKQRKILEIKMRELIRTLDGTKRALKEEGRRYADPIQKIEVSEEKRLTIERNIRELRISYIREKRISKDAFLRILKDYQNQINKFERDIDKELINLRLLVEHEKEE